MQKIKNKKCIYHLSYRILAAKKRKNLVAIIAIILTTIMFTALFTVTSNMIENFQKTTMRQVGSSSMVELKDILPKEYELFAKDKEVKNPSYRIFIGNAVNKELAKVNTEVYYTTKENAEKMFCLPTCGTMPKNKMDIVVSTRILDAMKLPYQLGQTVKLQISVNETIIENEFTLCGYWQGDRVAMAQMCFLSREYCDEVVPTVEVSVKENEYQYSGYWSMSFDFSNSFNIEKKTKELIKRNGYQLKDMEYGINWGYTFHSIDKEMVLCFFGIASLILISGYLIIYNIFSLNLVMEIQNYGLYKTIGMTEKQLKRLVRQEAKMLSLVGIPIGCILGVVFGKILFPFVIKNYETGGIVENSFHPFFLLFSAVFSFFTVWISCSRPCRLAAKVSPIEAVKYIEISKIKGKKKKKWSKMTICSLGWANLGRNKKKVALVICSLSLSLILLNAVYAIVHGFQLEKYVSNLLMGDAMVGDVSILNLASYEKNLEGITPKMKKEIANLPGVKEMHTISCNNASGIFLDQIGMEKLNTLLKKYKKFVKDQKEFFQYVKEDKELFCQMYGIDQWGTEQLSCYDGTVDWEKFQTGDYVLVSPWTANLVDDTTTESYYKPGEKVSLCFPDGTKKEYEIMAITEMPYALSSRFFNILGASVILPETEYFEHIMTRNSLWTVLFMEKGKEEIGYQSVRSCLASF